MIHYQFESIHPFYDGNGRTGRILNILYLVLNKLIDSPILYLSKYINKTKQEYYKLFNEVRDNNNFEDWILYILKGVEITSKETIELIEKIQTEMQNYKEEFRSKLPKIYSKELLASLFYEVYTKISYIKKACDVTRITAASYLNQLEEIGLLSSNICLHVIHISSKLYFLLLLFSSFFLNKLNNFNYLLLINLS